MADGDTAFSGSLRESKFASLLVPIRDLASNWGIDIANDLEEYLAHLNRTAFSFDGGPSLDFAEAALLIQSSACVYSKKVEYLHNLAYQALETVRCKKRPGEGAAGRPEAGQEGGQTQRGRAHDGEEDDSLEAFLAAGQDLKEADEKDLNLALEDEDAGASGYLRAPAALLALEDQGGGGGDGDAGFYRLAQCHVHMSGALFLDAMEADAYDAYLNNNGSGCAQAGVQAAMQQQQQLGGQAGTSGAAGAPADDDDDDDGGMRGDDDEAEAAAAAGVIAGQRPQDAIDQQQQGAGIAAAGAAFNGGVLGVGQPIVPPPVEEDGQAEEAYDAYKPLDMHSQGNLPIKPMQVRKPAKGKQLKPAVCAPRKPHASDPATRAAAAAGLVHPEFAYGLQLVSGSGKSKRGQGGQQQQPHQYFGQSVLDAISAATAAAVAEAMQDGETLGPQGDGAAGTEAGGAEGADAAGWDDDGGVGGGDDDDGGYDALDLMHDIGGNRSAWGEEGAGGEEGGNSYEDLCRAHIEAMVNAAAAQEVQSELAQRVSGWRTKIDPVLKDEESRSNFDIQMYAERIIKRLQDAVPPSEAASSSHAKQEAGFDAVAKEEVAYEVSRTFAAMLQLINNRNVELVKEGNNPDAPFRLQLLMAQLPHKRMAETLQGNIAEGQELSRQQEEQQANGAGTSKQARSKRPPKKKSKNADGS